ncbi:MAG TPA: glycosyltransferase family 2 protein [Candidatus Saccharimonadales bacterium]|nr:glycosyltransferase family 2 protein [Candidatus Saccharimonadales bacterium]
MNQKLSIIVPVYNEEKLISTSLPEIFKLSINKEVIVIDDGSSDKTLEILKELKKDYEFQLVIQEKNQGKGAAVKRGLEEISGNYFIICDADLEYRSQDIIFLYSKIDSLTDKTVIYGSRFKNNFNFSFHYFVNQFLTLLTNILFNSHLTDMETCFKLIPASALEQIKLSGKRFEIEPEITARLLKANYKIIEFPINYTRRSYLEGKKITANDGWLAVKTLFLERLKS